jgi:hypothetical protein
MTDIEKLERDIATLKESIELNRMHLSQRTQEELRGILRHTEWCMTELAKLELELKRQLRSN